MRMLIVACQVCGEVKVLAGTPDSDGMARIHWVCGQCGSGQVVQVPVKQDARGDLRRIIGGLCVTKCGEYVTAGGSSEEEG